MATHSDLLSVNSELSKLGNHYSLTLKDAKSRIAALEAQMGSSPSLNNPQAPLYTGNRVDIQTLEL